MDAGIRGILLLSVLVWAGSAGASPCNGIDLTGAWLSTSRSGVYVLNQSGCDSLTINTPRGDAVTVSFSGTSSLPTSLLSSFATRHGFRLADEVTFNSSINGGGASATFQVVRNVSEESLQAVATGSGTLVARMGEIIAEPYANNLARMANYIMSAEQLPFECPRGQTRVGPILTVNARVNSVRRGHFAHLLSDVRRSLEDRMGQSRASRVVPQTIVGLTYTDTLIKVRYGGAPFQVVSDSVCMPNATARRTRGAAYWVSEGTTLPSASPADFHGASASE